MSNKIVYEDESPVTQSLEAVKALLSACGKKTEPLPEFYRMSEDVVLVLSAKKDAYYTVTRTACSCPSNFYRPHAPCKHMMKYLGAKPVRITPDEAEQVLARSQKGGFRPTLEEAEA